VLARLFNSTCTIALFDLSLLLSRTGGLCGFGASKPFVSAAGISRYWCFFIYEAAPYLPLGLMAGWRQRMSNASA
jgi:hypothetical protein